jgi:hypothetical protein
MNAATPPPERHALVRGATTRPGRSRRIRPWTFYDCSCGVELPGTSRRQAKPHHLAHRKQLASAG